MERRAIDAAEILLEASGLRYQSGQIAGLAHVLVRFAQHELQIAMKSQAAGVDMKHLTAGTVVHVHGMPVCLCGDVEATAHKGTWGLIADAGAERQPALVAGVVNAEARADA